MATGDRINDMNEVAKNQLSESPGEQQEASAAESQPLTTDKDDRGRGEKDQRKAEETSTGDVVDTVCGYYSWRPKLIQRCNNSKALLMALCWFGFMFGFLKGITDVNTATLERRFGLHSSQVAWIPSSFHVSAAVITVVLGYLAKTWHKAKMITVGASIMSFGAFIIFLPHVLAGTYNVGDETLTNDICADNGNHTNGECNTEGVSGYLYVFILGNVCLGYGAVTLYNTALLLVEESTSSTDSPLYVGILHTAGALGPAVAYLGGGALLNLYVDIGRVDLRSVSITPEDPRWVGAWWIGIIIAGIGSSSAAFLLACFPRELPETKTIKASKKSEAHTSSKKKKLLEECPGKPWLNIVMSLKLIFSNPVWILITLAGILEFGVVHALESFLAKIIQFQFRMTPGAGAMIAGGLAISGAAGGQMLGGIIPRQTKMHLRTMVLTMGASSIVSGGLSACFLAHCETQRIAGVNVHYFNTSQRLHEEQVIHACNSDCPCSTSSYEPVCGHDSVEYFSPCHAGCTNVTLLPDGKKTYSDCSCIPEWSNASTLELPLPAMAAEGICEASCAGPLATFSVLLFIVLLFTFYTEVLQDVTTIRCVPNELKGFSFGLKRGSCRIFGNVSFALITGVMFDSSCLVWQEKCGQSGSCWVYDAGSMSVKLTLMLTIVKAVSAGCYFLAAYLYKPPRDDPPMEITVTT